MISFVFALNLNVQRLKTILLLAFYLIFSLGIGLNIHYCEKGSIDFSLFTSKKENKHCHNSCAHHNSDKNCDCEEDFVLLALSDNQLGFKNVTSNNLEIKNYFIYNKIDVLVKESNKGDMEIIPYNLPPPKSRKQILISNSSLVLYA